MSRKTRHIAKGGIVIICEGTETEYKYIEDAINKAIELGVFPFDKDQTKLLQSAEQYAEEHPEDKKLKKMNGSAAELRYYSKCEKTRLDYEKYCKQPTRYLREAQLFIEEDFYDEGWAVYDLDRHTDHGNAEELLNSDHRLHVAFSSYCIEEWLLTHFERCEKDFWKSECKDATGQKIECSPRSGHPMDCNGRECLAGYLRHSGYIPHYEKNGKETNEHGKVDQVSYFNRYSIDSTGRLRESMLINAAWHRYRADGQNRFQMNPYTDVDRLLQRIFDDHRSYTWVVPSATPVEINGIQLIIQVIDNQVQVTNNSKSSILFGPDSIKYFDLNAREIHPASPKITTSVYIEPGKTVSLPFVPGSLLKLMQGENNLIIELY